MPSLRSIRQHAIYAEREQVTQLLRPPRPRTRSRKDSEPSSPTPDSKSGDNSSVSKAYVSRRTSYLKATKTESDKDVKESSILMAKLGLETPGYHAEEKRQTTIVAVPAISKPRDLTLEAKEGSSKTSSEGEVIKEGPLSVKMDFKDGKRFADRSWKSVWAKLINSMLYLYRENRDSAGNTSGVEEHPVDISQAMVDIAYDYIKKKHVFRLCTVGGSDYLLNVNDQDTMLSWIACIQACRVSGSENQHVINEDLLLRRTQLHEPRKQTPPRTPSPNDSQKRAAKETSSLKKGSQRQSKKPRNKLLPPTQEEVANDSLTFGICLEDCPSSATHEFVPLFLERCCSIVETYGLDMVGVYRVPGNTGGIGYLKSELKKDIREVDFTDERWRDVNVISSLLKLFFRKLLNPLIPTDQYSSFIQANRTPSPPERMANLRRQIHNLPEHHFATLKFLTNHLKLISNNSHINKMEVRNLAIVFGPTLIRTADDNMITMVQDMSDQCKIVESVIEHCDWFFCEDVESQQNVPMDALPGADIMSDSNILLAKAREEKRQYDTISPKDIMASVLSAANRKLKRPDRRSFDATKYTDEKDAASTTSSSSKQSQHTRGSSRTESQSTEADSSVSCNDELTQTGLIVNNQIGNEQPDFRSFLFHGEDLGEFTFGSVRGRNLGDSSPNSKKLLHDFSKNRHERGDGTVSWIMRVNDPPTIQQEWKQTEYSKARERIEQEHRLALQDYEKDESTNLEEIIQSKERLKDICSTKVSAMESAIQDTSSVTSDYSTTSSNNNNCFTDTPNTLDTKGSRSLTPDSNVSHGSSEDSEFVRSITAAFEATYQSLFQKETDEDCTIVAEESENSLSGTEQRPDNIPRSKSFTSGALLSADRTDRKPENQLDRPSSLDLADRGDAMTVSTASQPLLVSPRTPQRKTKIELTLVFEKSEVTPKPEKITKSHSLENSPEKRHNLSPAARKEMNKQIRQRRHTLGGPNDARNKQKVVEITLVGEHITTKDERSSPVRRLKSSQSFGKGTDLKVGKGKKRHCSSDPSLIKNALESGKSLTLPARKIQDITDKDCHPQKLNAKQEFFEIQAAL